MKAWKLCLSQIEAELPGFALMLEDSVAFSVIDDSKVQSVLNYFKIAYLKVQLASV